MKRSLAVVSLVLACAAFAPADDRALDLPIGDPARNDRQMPVVLDGITDAVDGATLTPPELAERLDGVRILFVGESHTDIEFHRVQLRVVQELHRRGRTVIVGLEMFPASAGEWLDRWISDRTLTEQGFLDEAHWYRSWGYNWGYYRDIFLFAREEGIRMVGVNIPRDVVQVVRRKGFEGLSPEHKALLPERVDLDDAEHQRLFRAFFGAEDSLHGNMPQPMFDGMFRAQCAWDAAMGWNAVKAFEASGDENAIVVVLVGSGHVAYGLGAERQARLWFDGRMVSLIPIPIGEPDEPGQIEEVRASYADFVWGLPPVTDPLYPSLGISTPERKTGEHYKVIMVAPDSVGGAAGFQVGDDLIAMDGVAIDEKETSRRLMSTKRWGDTVLCEIVRDGKPLTLTAHLRRQRPATGAAAAAEPAEVPNPAPSHSRPPHPMPPHGEPGEHGEHPESSDHEETHQ